MSRVGVSLKLAAMAAVLPLLATCATLDREQCASVDWRRLGESDGAAGRHPSHVEAHRRSCAEHKLPIDETSWRMGWERGITFYCTPQNGLSVGLEGGYYADSCPADLSADFTGAYRVAKRLHDARSSRDQYERELRDLEARWRRESDREKRAALDREIDDKRRWLRGAEQRVREAQRDYEIYVLTNRLSLR